MIKAYPEFAVVGHPNKGKSSIVSTLAHDESVQISNTPGTTTKQRSFPLKIDGEILYELYDTPGFQRARAVLAWLKREEVPADQKVDRVRRFVYEHRDDSRFHDEVELLEPILNGAGIIYVVDGSKPYGPEYEAEMEILRWTGQPSMALINLIDETDYVEEWKRALGHYFRMVRVFNPMEANFSQHIALLESMAQLKEEWTPSVKQSIEIFSLFNKLEGDFHFAKKEKALIDISELKKGIYCILISGSSSKIIFPLFKMGNCTVLKENSVFTNHY